MNNGNLNNNNYNITNNSSNSNNNNNNNNKVSVRFIIDRKHQYVCLLDKDQTFKQIEDYLLSIKPKELFNDNNGDNDEIINFKFLYSGKLFNYKQTIKDLISTQNKFPLNCQLILIKKSKQQQTQQAQAPPSGTTTDNEIEIHFHGCFFDYDEFKKIEEIFNKKEDPNEKVVNLQFLNKFLHSYWEFLIQRQQPELIVNNGNGNNFPTSKLSTILRNVLKVPSLNSETQITKEQFRIIFYLFSSNSDSNICPNGNYNSILKMIEQYHPTIFNENQDDKNQLPFDKNDFDKIFNLVLSIQPQDNNNNNNNNNSLSCKNIELLFYLYTACIVLKIEEKENENQSNKNKNNVTIPPSV